MPFAKGTSWKGNRNGRPKKGDSITDLVESIGHTKKGGKERIQIVVEKLYELAERQSKPEEVSAAKYVTDRVYGKTPEKLEHSGSLNQGDPYAIEYKTVAFFDKHKELHSWKKKYLEWLKA